MTEHFSCVECGRSFVCSYDEQRWFLERGLSLPKRCKACRSARRLGRDSGMQGIVGGVAPTAPRAAASKTTRGAPGPSDPTATNPTLHARLKRFLQSIFRRG
jgi:hypothetical protein